jgi:serine protease Do
MGERRRRAIYKVLPFPPGRENHFTAIIPPRDRTHPNNCRYRSMLMIPSAAILSRFAIRALLLLAASSSVSSAEPPSTAAPALPDFAALVRQESAAVVNIRVYRTRKPGAEPAERPEAKPSRPAEPQESGLGSGFVVSPNGVILTNRHVVADAEKIRVRFTDRREMPARILGVDPLTDVAVLKVEAEKLPVVRIGDSRRLQVGQWVLAIGAPLGLERTATHGIISALGRSLPNDSYVSFIQTDVPINPGNSGGPLFDPQGRVVGINSQIVSNSGGYMGLSFAIPINDALWVARQIVETGRVAHGWLGVGSQELTLELAQAHGLEVPRGALVTEVAPGGPAEHAGLLSGDIIVRLDDVEIVESADLPPLIGAATPGKEVALTVLREGKSRQIKVRTGEWGRDNAPEKFRKTPLVRHAVLGVGVSTLNAAARQVLNIEGGLLVEEVGEGPALDAGVRPGDILVRLAGVPLADAARLGDAVARAPVGRPVALLVKRQEQSSFVAIVLPRN